MSLHPLKTARQYLSSTPVFYCLDFIRQFPETISWLLGGCSGVAPRTIKRRVIKAHISRFKLKSFVETGTYLGDTLAYVASDARILCKSVEVEDRLFAAAKVRFSKYANVELLHGDSGEILNTIVSTISVATLFWLDGHFSGGVTGRGAADTPILAELATICGQQRQDFVILIDDARCFDGTNGYPTIEEVLALARGRFAIEVSTDIIRLTPLVLP